MAWLSRKAPRSGSDRRTERRDRSHPLLSEFTDLVIAAATQELVEGFGRHDDPVPKRNAPDPALRNQSIYPSLADPRQGWQFLGAVAQLAGGVYSVLWRMLSYHRNSKDSCQ